MAIDKNIECLVIGANGLIGRRISQALEDKGIKWKGTYSKRQREGLVKLDITRPNEIKDLFSKFSPNAVFHCANLAGGVNFCELNYEIASEFHLNATKEIGRYCRDIGATMIFLSTDYVFDGTKKSYREEDDANPLNLYGKLKLESEEWIKNNLERYLVIRTTNVYGWDPESHTPNYIMNLYHKIKNQERFDAPQFLWGNPTYVGDLAESLIELYAKGTAGIFHIVGSSFVNRYEWAIEACKVLNLDSSLIKKAEEPQHNIVRRPLKSHLNAEKFSKSFRTVLRNLYEGLMLMRSDMQ